MVLNRMICPRCRHEVLTENSYVTCSSCFTFYYASQSGKTLGEPIVFFPKTTDGKP